MFIFGRLPKSNFISMHFISYKWFQLFQSTVSELRRPKSCGITAPVRRWFNSLLTSFLIFCMVSSRTIFPFHDWKLVKRNHFPLHFENHLSNLCSKMAFLSELAIVSSSSQQCLLWKLTCKSIHNYCEFQNYSVYQLSDLSSPTKSPITHDGLSNQYNYWLSRVPSELIDFLIKIQTSWDQGLLLELIDSDQHTISCDQELLSELIDCLIDTQTSCDQELSSELIDSLIIPQLLVISSSHQSSLMPLLTHKLYKIRSFYKSSLTPILRYKLLGIKSSHQSSLIP